MVEEELYQLLLRKIKKELTYAAVGTNCTRFEWKRHQHVLSTAIMYMINFNVLYGMYITLLRAFFN
jgi:hypothetical protein